MKNIILIPIFFFFSATWLNAQWTCGDTLTDQRDGKKYPTVQIGNQCWMAKNLNYGIEINSVTLASDNGVIEKYCYGNISSNCDVHGGLYSWDEVMDYYQHESAAGICPYGWHIPDDDEIKQLEMTLGMDSATANLSNVWRGTDQGTQMLSGGTSGLNILFSGIGLIPSGFMLINSYSYIYSSSQSGSNAWRRCLNNASSQVGRFDSFPKSYAMSVRCILGFDSVTVNTQNIEAIKPLSMYYFDGQLVVQYSQSDDMYIIVSTYDLAGRIVYSGNIHCSPGDGILQVNLPSLAKGMYIVNAVMGRFAENIRIVIQ